MPRFLRPFLAALFAAALLLGSGCRDNGGGPSTDEKSDPLYLQAQDYKRQGRNSEALNAFLHEIDRRGESNAPESHLEAGLLYLNFVKDPIEAYHHFSRYLDVRPNDQAVRDQRDAAMRDISRILHAPPSDQMFQAQANDEIAQLRRRVAELQAENEALHGGGAYVNAARPPPMISLPDDRDAVSAPPPIVADSPLTPAPAAEPPAAARASPPRGYNVQSAAPASRPNPATASPRAGVPQHPAAAGARTYTVQRGDTAYGIARRFYGAADNARVNAIIQANRNIVQSASDLKPGMVLRIP